MPHGTTVPSPLLFAPEAGTNGHRCQPLASTGCGTRGKGRELGHLFFCIFHIAKLPPCERSQLQAGSALGPRGPASLKVASPHKGCPGVGQLHLKLEEALLLLCVALSLGVSSLHPDPSEMTLSSVHCPVLAESRMPLSSALSPFSLSPLVFSLADLASSDRAFSSHSKLAWPLLCALTFQLCYKHLL